MAVMGALGVLAAVGVAAGDDDTKACVEKRSGAVREAGEVGHCTAREAAITISGDAFKAGRRGTITINGVSFKRSSRGGTLTINGVPFTKGSRGKTLTINGTAFRTGTLPNTLTINGNSFRTGTLPNTITINGNSFRKGAGGTLTINGTEFAPGAAKVQGERGPTGPAGPQGPAGIAGGPASEVAGPVSVNTGAGATQLITAAFTNSDGRPHRLLLAGGFSVVCNPCSSPVTANWSLSLSGAADTLVRRRISRLEGADSSTGATVSDVVVSPDVCNPCTYALSLTASGGSGQAQTVDATDIRLAVVDLGAA